jgi:hypothetical protein
VDDQWYVDGREQPLLSSDVVGIVVGTVVGVRRDVELPLPAAGSGAAIRCAPLGTWLVGAGEAPREAVDVPGAAGSSGPDVVPSVIGAVPAAVSFGDVRVMTAMPPATPTTMTAATTTAVPRRRANNRRLRFGTFPLFRSLRLIGHPAGPP